jgi:Putative adhesin
MQRYLAIAGLGLALWIPAAAQESQGPRVVVPARNGSHPRVVKATASNAGITVRTHEGTDIIVEETDGSRRGWRRAEPAPAGMHRIDLPPGLSVTEDGDVVEVRIPAEAGSITLTVPVETSLQLKSSNGGIRVDGVHGEVDASSSNAALELQNISGTVVADTSNGAIHATMDRVDPAKPISFSSTNGAVDVTLPADLKANFKMRTTNGGIWTDFEMRLAGGQPETRRGTISGTVNGGGVEASFSTVNGKIVIHKK